MVNLKNILGRFGIDGPIFFTLLSRIFQGLGGFVSIFLIAHFMSKEVQGFYYTFSSVLAIQIFFELGLGTIIIQFVAHEMAFLKISDDNRIVGNEENRSRLASIAHFCFKWYLVFALLLFVVLIVAGYYFFSTYGSSAEHVEWITPWFMVSFLTALSLLISPWMAVLQGMNKVKEMAKLSLIQQITISFVAWAALYFGANLYVGAISAFSGIVLLLYLYYKAGFVHLLLNLYRTPVVKRVNYKTEIFPLQWKIALSWISGYFIFQMFNPVIFAVEGPAVAGQAGMTLTVLNAILGLIVSWTGTKVPYWSQLIANKNYRSLDLSTNAVIRDSTVIGVVSIGGFLVLLTLLNVYFPEIAGRFLPVWLCFVLLSTIIINNIVNIWATYLRCHKKEPFLFQALIVGCLCAFSTFFLGKFYGVAGIFIGYAAIVYLISLPISYRIFITKKIQYNV